MKLKELALALFLVGLCFADLTIPADQPICRLYGMIQIIGTAAGIIVAAYAGLVLASSHEMIEKNNAKALIGSVIIGLIVIWIAPLLVNNLVGSSGICGW